MAARGGRPTGSQNSWAMGEMAWSLARSASLQGIYVTLLIFDVALRDREKTNLALPPVLPTPSLPSSILFPPPPPSSLLPSPQNCCISDMIQRITHSFTSFHFLPPFLSFKAYNAPLLSIPSLPLPSSLKLPPYLRTFNSVSVKRAPLCSFAPEGVGVADGRGLGEAPPPEESVL